MKDEAHQKVFRRHGPKDAIEKKSLTNSTMFLALSEMKPAFLQTKENSCPLRYTLLVMKLVFRKSNSIYCIIR